MISMHGWTVDTALWEVEKGGKRALTGRAFQDHVYFSYNSSITTPLGIPGL